ncbi:MAG TPA: hypothetical protein VFB38_13355 [Chthonomonadaceae bacterium]|nr:hypothetical protein [Chthonomonadaceae bacterium]
MRRMWIICPALAAIGLSSSVAVYKFQQRAEAQENDYTTWQPDAAAIRTALAALPAASGAHIDDTRHKEFAQLFQRRFRTHEPAMAVGLHFRNNHLIKLLCPARLEPWNANLLALSAWQEAREAFGQPWDVDIYATYIGIPPVKIGMLRPLPDHPDIARITYRYPREMRSH